MSSPQPVDRGLVAAPQCEAAFEGARVLTDGGNAADALVTASLVQGIVDPHRCGLGGFGCATISFHGSPPLAVDFHGRAGSRAREDQWVDIFESAAPDGFGYVVRGKENDVGHRSITVPGMLAGVAEIHGRFGRMPWRDLVLRAVPYAEEGFLVTHELAEFWIRDGLFGRVATRDRIGHTAYGRSIALKPDGRSYAAGETFRQPDLADTYRHIAENGPEDFYRGELAQRIAEDWRRGDALVTGEDLASYRVEVHEPLRGHFRGHEILTSPLPGGGVALLQTLALVERTGLATFDPGSAASIDALGRILQAVWADRLANQGDPAFGTEPAQHFLSDEYLRRLLAPPSLPHGADAGGTTQLTIVDSDGNAISFSHSLGYNSGVFCPGTGVLFNNCMSAFDPIPGRKNSIAPGKARSTAVAETIVLRRGAPSGSAPWLTLGSPGAARITAGLAQVILGVVDAGLDVAEAVVRPRFDAYGPGTLTLDSRFPPPVLAELRGRGWNVKPSVKPFGVIGRVYAIEERMDRLVAGVDPGAPGAAYRGGGCST